MTRRFIRQARVVAVVTATALLLLPDAWGSSRVTTTGAHRTYFAQGFDSQYAAYRPSVLQLSADAEILVEPARWSSWTSTLAKGDGTLAVDNCQPNCAQGHYAKHHVLTTLSNPHAMCGKRFFT